MIPVMWFFVPGIVQADQEKSHAPASSSLPPVTVGVRFGAQLSPRFSFAGGLDFDLNRLSIGPGWTSRIDLEAISEPSGDGLFSGLNTTAAATFNQIYSPYYRNHQRRIAYVGFGIGYYNSPTLSGTSGILGNNYRGVGHFGGKIFFGSQFTSTTSAELGIHFPGDDSTLLTAQMRLKL